MQVRVEAGGHQGAFLKYLSASSLETVSLTELRALTSPQDLLSLFLSLGVSSMRCHDYL